MKSVWQPSVRGELKSRVAKLGEHQTPGWGKMTAGRMVVHVADTFRSSIGELAIKPPCLPLRLFGGCGRARRQALVALSNQCYTDSV